MRRHEDDLDDLLDGLTPELRHTPGVEDVHNARCRWSATDTASGRMIYGGANTLADAKKAAEQAFLELRPTRGCAAYAGDEHDPAQRWVLLALKDGWIQQSPEAQARARRQKGPDLDIEMLDDMLAHVDGMQSLQNVVFALADEVSLLPLDDMLAHLDALERTNGYGISKAEWAKVKHVHAALRALAEPLQRVADIYIGLEEHVAREKQERPS